MKYCPTCETRFEEEIIRFCTKDGTPLINEEEPKFVQMPSESLDDAVEDDPGDVTVIRRNVSAPQPLPSFDEEPSFAPDKTPSQRIVVPTTPEPREPYQGARTARAYYPPPRQNTFKVVVLTVIGTLFVLGLGALGFWFLQKDNASNTNVNLNANLPNVNTNLNNLGIDTNFNFNTSSNFNLNSNINTNANLRTPTPTPKPSPSPSPSPSPTPDEDATPTRTPIPTPTPIVVRPGASPAPSPRFTPRVLITPSNRPN